MMRLQSVQRHFTEPRTEVGGVECSVAFERFRSALRDRLGLYKSREEQRNGDVVGNESAERDRLFSLREDRLRLCLGGWKERLGFLTTMPPVRRRYVVDDPPFPLTKLFEVSHDFSLPWGPGTGIFVAALDKLPQGGLRDQEFLAVSAVADGLRLQQLVHRVAPEDATEK